MLLLVGVVIAIAFVAFLVTDGDSAPAPPAPEAVPRPAPGAEPAEPIHDIPTTIYDFGTVAPSQGECYEDLTVLPCRAPHEGEIVVTFTIVPDDILEAGFGPVSDRCVTAVTQALGGSVPPNSTVHAFIPNAEVVERADDLVRCGIEVEAGRPPIRGRYL
ncbi:MAG TPA: hypothetical protein VD926_14980 [Acidimicrobiales bacterium]|nr:hypothetical protein [Acidimicrobiales bacterium]